MKILLTVILAIGFSTIARAQGDATQIASQDKLIRDVLDLGGIKKECDSLPEVFISSMVSGCTAKSASQLCSLMKQAAEDSFKSQDFYASVFDALELNFDNQKLNAILRFFQSPLSRKVTQESLEAESPENMEKKAAFAKELLANPPSQAGEALFERNDKATGTTDLAVSISTLIALQMYDAFKKSTSQKSQDDSQAKLEMEMQLSAQLRGPMKEASRLSFFYDARDLTDDEINQEVTFEESDTGRWFTKITNEALMDAMKQAGAKMAQKLVVLAKKQAQSLEDEFKSFSDEQLYQQVQHFLDSYSGRPQPLQNAALRLSVLLKRSPDFPKTYIALARLVLISGHIYGNEYNPKALQAALMYIDKAIAMDHTSAVAYRLAGYIQMDAVHLDKAKEMLQKAKELSPGAMNNDLLEASIAEREERYTDALALDETALGKAKTKRDQERVYDNLVEDYKQTGQKDKAKEIFLKIIELMPDRAWPKSNFAEYLNYLGEWDEAIDWAQKALAQMNYGAAHRALADAYYRKGYDLYWVKHKYNEGGPYFEKAYAEKPDIKGLNYSLADYYRSINRLKDAVDAYRRELDNDPGNQNAQQELDRTLAAMGQGK